MESRERNWALLHIQEKLVRLELNLNNQSFLSTNNLVFVGYFGALTLLISSMIFGSDALSFQFTIHALIVLFLSLSYYSVSKYVISQRYFLRKILAISLLLRIVAVFFYYYLFQEVTDTPFEVTFADSIYYDNKGNDFANILRYGASELQIFFSLGTNLDDIGYQIFLGVIYFFTDNSILVARVVQAIVGTWSVYIAYRILQLIYNEKVAREGAIIFSGFHCFILYSTLHLREFLLVHVTLLMVYYFLCFNVKPNIKSFTLLFTTIVVMLFFRTVYALAFIGSVGVYLAIFEIKSIKTLILGLLFLGFLVVFLANSPFFDSTWTKLMGYVGFGEQRGLGGYTQEKVVSRGMSLAKYIGGPIFILPSFIFPIPSVLKLNIEEFGRSMHWYFTGGLFVWLCMSYFYFKGAFRIIIERNKFGIFILILVLFHTLVLLQSFYFPSIRFSQVKMSLLLLLVPIGSTHLINMRRGNNNFLIYVTLISLIVLGYNYLRLFGRM